MYANTWRTSGARSASKRVRRGGGRTSVEFNTHPAANPAHALRKAVAMASADTADTVGTASASDANGPGGIGDDNDESNPDDTTKENPASPTSATVFPSAFRGRGRGCC